MDSLKDKSAGPRSDINAIKKILKKMAVDIFEGDYLSKTFNNALILCLDIRNFSDFLCSHEEDVVYKLITDFSSNLLACINFFGCGCSYYKLMGDGALIIWDESNEKSSNEAISVFNTYSDFLNEDLFKKYNTLGLAGALVEEKLFKYEISAETSQIKYRDYIGYGINLSCRLQTLANTNELILNELITESKCIPFKINQTPEILKELKLLKGLKGEDRKRLLLYDKK